MKFYELFDSLNECVYVSEIETYKIIYMNKKALKEFGYSELSEVKNKKCYEIISGGIAPCSRCNCAALRAGEFIEWKDYNPVMDKYLLVKDTRIEEDGKSYHLQISIDVSEQEKRDRKFTDYQNTEALVNKGIRLALQAAMPDKSIEIILEYLGTVMNAERTYIFEQKPNKYDDNTYEWVAQGVTSEKENLQNIPPEACENWYKAFEKQGSIIIPDIEEIKDNNRTQYEILKAQNIHSVIVAPLYEENRLIGFYGVDNPPKERFEYCSNLLKTMGYFMEVCIKRRKLLKKLKHISYTDQLTNIGNRHAMNEFIESSRLDNIDIGIVFADITGLKKVNDTEGHVAGDKYIVEACNCIKRIFGEYNLYRTGGDEFLVICVGITNSKLDELEHKLIDDIVKHGVTMAVGSNLFNGSQAKFEEAIRYAEEKMYDNKRRYYEENGIDRRRV